MTTPTILTGSWFSKLPATHIKIGISRGVPRGLAAGYRRFKRLAPGPWFNRVNAVEYDRLYKAEILAPLKPATVILQILAAAAGKTPVLCCYEMLDHGEWCHRAMAAQWLADHLKQTIPEFGFEALPQHEHPLMPQELRRVPVAVPEANDDVTPFIGKEATIHHELHRVISADPNNPGQAIVEASGRRFSTTLNSLRRYFS